MKTSVVTMTLGTATLVAALTAPAFGLDAYRDRTGVFYGGGVGFGAGKADSTGAETKAGFNLDGRVGGGITQNLTLDFDLGLTKQLGIDTTLVKGFIGVNLFPAGDLSLRLMGGIAHASIDGGKGTTGLGAGAGLGYEFWANADMAVAVGVDLQRHFYDSVNFTALNFGLAFTHY